MIHCDYCNMPILFNPRKYADLNFCHPDCFEKRHAILNARNMPEPFYEEVRAVHDGYCPKCHGRGPVDIHTIHSIWTVWNAGTMKQTQQLSCHGCASKDAIIAFGKASLFGWWGLKGLFFTPVVLSRNLGTILFPPNPSKPSPTLTRECANQAIKAGKYSVLPLPPETETVVLEAERVVAKIRRGQSFLWGVVFALVGIVAIYDAPRSIKSHHGEHIVAEILTILFFCVLSWWNFRKWKSGKR